MNLVSLIMKFLTPDMIGKIATALGLDQVRWSRRASAPPFPAILAGLAGAAGKPGGADMLSNAIGKQDSGLLGSLAGMLGGGGQTDLVSNGGNVLGSLLGGNSAVGGLAGAVGKFSGLGNGAGSLLGLLAPVVLGTLGQQQKASGLDAGGLAKLLGGQKDNIAAAMPPGLRRRVVSRPVSATSSAASAKMASAAVASAGGTGGWAAVGAGSCGSAAASAQGGVAA